MHGGGIKGKPNRRGRGEGDEDAEGGSHRSEAYIRRWMRGESLFYANTRLLSKMPAGNPALALRGSLGLRPVWYSTGRPVLYGIGPHEFKPFYAMSTHTD